MLTSSFIAISILLTACIQIASSMVRSPVAMGLSTTLGPLEVEIDSPLVKGSRARGIRVVVTLLVRLRRALSVPQV